MNDFRLRKDVRPSRYELRFDLDLDRWTSKGTGAITLRTDRPAREIVLHSVDLDITAASLDGAAMTGVSYDEDSQTATITLPAEQAPGEHVLRLEWTGGIREALRGLYRSTRGEERYAATQFEAADARRAMPCFDEPEFKAKWVIELEHDSSLVAISNAPIAEQKEVRPGRTRTRFAETPKISSYLVAFCVGPFESTPVAKSASGSDVRVWLPPGLAVRGVYARDAHVRALGYLEEYTGIPYPYAPKVDAIGLPDFEAGAMENPGAITYRTTYLAVDERTASSAAFKGCFSVAAHELTHMWWGDLVTMAWWTDLWLNESFASFVGEKATTSLNPEWGYERDVVSQNTSAFNLDALVSTHPISVEAKNADEASERFDAVTYLKGQGVLRMIENFIGADAFRAGVRIYLDRHREANATASDFWRALDEASRKDVSKIADAWIHEPGHPLVTCTTRETAGALEIELRQTRFFADPAQQDTGQRWPVPVVIKYGTDGGTREHRVLLESASQTVQLEGARWYYPNARGTGFYRTALDDRAVALVAQNIGSLEPEERLALLDNQWALARAHKAGVAQVLELVAGLGGEDDRYVLALLAEILGWLSTHAVTDATRDAFRRTVDRLFRPQLERLGWDVRQDDTADEREKRAIVISSLGLIAAAKDVRAEARRRVDAHLDGTAPLHPDIARASVGVAAAEGDVALWQRYVQRMRSAAQSDAQEEARFRQALLDFEDPAIVDRTADDIFTDLIRDQDRALMYLRLLGLRHGRAIGWKALQRHWDTHVVYMDPAGKQRCVNAASQLSPRDLAEQAIAFLQAKQTPDLKENVAQAVERVRLLAATAERMSRELGDALGRVPQPA